MNALFGSEAKRFCLASQVVESVVGLVRLRRLAALLDACVERGIQGVA
jgi:hypothetical protein